ncbi:MAG TPA: tetratricopeptide repeat protein, partial [Roseiflexaceae bacterium]
MMTENLTSEWARAYLQAICAHPQFNAAIGVAPLWLTHEGGESTSRSGPASPLAARLTIQMAAEMFPRMALVGPAGAGKTTLLRQLARVLAEAILAEESLARRGAVVAPLPLYIELARFEQSIEATMAATFDLGTPPPLGELVRERPLLLLLDGLEELAPEAQLAGLSALSQTLTALGGQACWIATCRAESLPLFRPWLGAAEIRAIHPLPPRDVIAMVQRQNGELAAWLQGADDIVSLATRARWLAALAQLDPRPPYSRGQVLDAWLSTVVDATLEAHSSLGTAETALAALPALAMALDQRRQDTLTLAEASAAIEAEGIASGAGHLRSARPTIRQLAAAGILTLDTKRQEIAFRHPALRSFSMALAIVRTRPDTWPASIFSRVWNDTVVFAYSLCGDREALLRRLLSNGAVHLAARCLIDAEPIEQFEALLDRSGTLTPPLRVMLAEAFADEGLNEAAREQLERAGAEGYDEAGLFGRLGELYSAAGQWHHARAAYEQALARDADGLRYRQELGVVYSRLGEMDAAAAALQAVLDAQQRRSAEAAFELGHVYIEQGQVERALAVYRQAAASRPDEPAYRRGIAGALRLLNQLDEAETILRELLAEDSADAATHAELGQVCASAGRPHDAIACFTKAVALQPASAEYYGQLGQLRRALGDLPGARAAMQRAAELDPSNAALQYALGQACEESDEPDGAIVAYRYAIRLDGRNEAYLRRLGALLRDRGEDEQAAQALQTALELRPDSAETHSELAALLWRQGQREQALESYARVLALAPGRADDEQALGMIYRELGRPREALRHLQHAAELDPRRAELHHDIATAAEAIHDWDAALASYE